MPARSATVLVTTTNFNDRGEAYLVTDPEATANQSTFDDANRLIKLLENYVSGGTDDDENRETDYTYAPNGQVATLTAKNGTNPDQVTQFLYGVDLTTSDVASNELLREKVYPDDVVSMPDRTTFAYNRLNQVKQATDPNGTVHGYDYDKLGRLIGDRVTALGTNIDGAVLRIGATYEVRGMLQKITSYDAATAGNIVNEAQFAYNTFKQVATGYQSHAGAVNTGTTPKVQYDHVTGTGNTVRLTTLTYPDGRALTLDYGSSGGTNDALSRIGALKESTNTRAGYQYLGLQTVVQIAYGEPGVEMTYIGSAADAGDQYSGLDRFGRIVDVRWDKSGTDLERVKYGYDQASNRLWRQNTVAATGQDQYYAYDGLYQVDDLQQGTLNGGKTGITGTPSWEEDFTYDPIGNWKNYLTKTSGTTTLNQPRTFNTANKIQTISSSSGQVGFDRTGNMTKAPKPTNWSSAYTLVYDAWDRLVQVKDGATVVAAYAYDGLTRRVTKTIASDVRHYYYSADWQVLEERLNGATTSDKQWMWGIRGIDDLVLRDTTTERLYALRDAMSITTLVNTSGAVVERYGYDAFGSSHVMDASFAPRASSSYGWEVRFACYSLDLESNFYHVRFRYLHPMLGRWLSRDPIGESGGINLYAYVGNNPVQYLDPLGTSFWSSFGSGFAGGLATGMVVAATALVAAAIAPGAAAVLTGALAVAGAVGGAYALYSVLSNPSADNIGYNAGALLGGSLVGGMSGRALSETLSSALNKPMPGLAGWNPLNDAAQIWRNDPTQSLLENWNNAMATGPNPLSAAGAVGTASAGAGGRNDSNYNPGQDRNLIDSDCDGTPDYADPTPNGLPQAPPLIT